MWTLGQTTRSTYLLLRAFYDRGWCGLNIEPVPAWVERLQAYRPRDTNLALAASDSVGEMTFHELESSGLSSAVDRHAEEAKARGFRKRTYTVRTDTLARILDRYAPADIHFLKVDVEGAEASVLAGTDFEKHRPWIVLVEATEPLSDKPSYAHWEPLLLSAGYVFTMSDGLNRWYVAREHSELIPAVSFPADRYELVGEEVLLREENASLREQLARFREHPALKPALLLRRQAISLGRNLRHLLGR